MREDGLRGPAAAGAPAAGDVELVVVAYRSRPQLEGLLAALGVGAGGGGGSGDSGLAVVVVDNSDGSDGCRELVESLPRGRYLPGGGVGFARAATAGALSSTAPHLVFVNPDVRPTPEQVMTLVADVAADPTCAASAGVLVDDDGRVALGAGGWEPSPLRALVHAVGLHNLLPRAGLFARPRVGVPVDVDWVSGGCMAVRREVFVALGGFDTDFYVYNEDMAFGRASRQHGLHERLRTDVAVRGGSGGSGAPSAEMMRLRGASMAAYARKHHGRAPAALIAAGYGGGYVLRAVAALARRRPGVARAHTASALGALTGTARVAGRVVVDRSTGA